MSGNNVSVGVNSNTHLHTSKGYHYHYHCWRRVQCIGITGIIDVVQCVGVTGIIDHAQVEEDDFEYGGRSTRSMVRVSHSLIITLLPSLMA